MAEDLQKAGVTIAYDHTVTHLELSSETVTGAKAVTSTGLAAYMDGLDAVISTMPIQELIPALSATIPSEVAAVSAHLPYRNSIIVTVAYTRLLVSNSTSRRTRAGMIPDNWIYIQESSTRCGRISIVNNFSEFMLRDANTVLLSLEYFCDDDDAIWSQSTDQILRLAQRELEELGIAAATEFISGTAVKVEKSYPAYFGAYERFDVVREYLDGITNLFPAGRNGQHRYNNMDHSIASGFAAAEAIVDRTMGKGVLWSINTDKEYHEGR